MSEFFSRIYRFLFGPFEETEVHVVKAGDTLSWIAAKRLSDARRWPEIADLNDIRSPYLLHVGQVLKLPKWRAD